MVRIYYFVEDLQEDKFRVESQDFETEKEADEYCYNYEIEVIKCDIV